MKLVVENWIEAQGFKKSVNTLFDESVKCYRAGAYRAAYVFSYLAFLTELKTRILNVSDNRSVPSGMWTDLRAKLLNEDRWEEALLNCINNEARQVFIINQDLREQVFYWKNRRNDCVHYKNDLINNAFVESFWSFLRTYLPKFVLNGSRESLLKKFSDHFNVSKTVPNLTFSHLSKEVHLSVDGRDYQEFFEALVEDEYTSEFIAEIFDDFLTECHENVRESLEAYLVTDEPKNKRLFNELIHRNPQRLMLIKDDLSRIRLIWHSKLFNNNQNDYDILAFLLRNGMIPSDQIQESIDVTVEKIIQKNYSYLPSDQDSEDMRNFGFYEKLREKLFSPDGNAMSKVEWYNSHSNLIKSFLQKVVIDKELVEKLDEVICVSFHPYALKNRLYELFKSNPSIKVEINKVALDNNINVCDFLKGDAQTE